MRYRDELARRFQNGLDAYARNNLEKAVEYFRNAKNLADKYEFYKESKDAQNYINKISYNLSEKYYHKGFELVRKNDFEGAFRAYKTSLGYNPSNTSADFELKRVGRDLSEKYYEEGMSYYSQSNFEKARASLKRALDYDKENQQAKRALERLQ